MQTANSCVKLELKSQQNMILYMHKPCGESAGSYIALRENIYINY